MRLTTYFIIMFSIQLMLYFMGHQTLLFQLWDEFQGGINIQSLTTIMAKAIATTNPLVLALGGVAVAIALYAGFSAMFIIPLMILLSILNFIVVPAQIFLPASCPSVASAALLGAVCQPEPLGLVVILFLNICTVLTFVEFVRGSA